MTSPQIAVILNEHPAADRIFTKNAVIGEAHRQGLRQLNKTPVRIKPPTTWRSQRRARSSWVKGCALGPSPVPLTLEEAPVVARSPADPAPAKAAQAPEPAALEPDVTLAPVVLSAETEAAPAVEAPPVVEAETPPPAPKKPRPASNVVRLPTRQRPRPPVINPELLWFDKLSAKFDTIVFSPSHGRCQFPIGEPRKPGFHFCGARATTAVYCREHDRLCHGFRAG